MDGLVIGKLVHFVVRPDRTELLQHRPAVVTWVWNDEGMVNLQVYTDGTYDNAPEGSGTYARTSIAHEPEGGENSWHELGPCLVTVPPTPEAAPEGNLE